MSRAIRDAETEGESALVLVRNDVAHDSRIVREVQTLRSIGFRPMVLGQASPGAPPPSIDLAGASIRRASPGLTRVTRSNEAAPVTAPADAETGSMPRAPGPRAAALGFAQRVNRTVSSARYLASTLRVAGRKRPALVHCNDHNTMWAGLAVRALHGSAVVFDSHELWADRNRRPEWRRRLLVEEALFVRAAHRTVTTSPGYAAVLAQRHRVEPPELVRNVPTRRGWFAAPTAAAPTVVYVGGLTFGRGLEQTIAAVALLDGVRLRLIGPARAQWAARLARLAEEQGLADRVEIRPPVAPTDVPAALADAHVGVALIQPVCLSYELTLPNKLFEYVAAGVPLLVSDLPVMRDFVTEHDIGMAAPPDRPEAIAQRIGALLEPERNAQLRENVRRAASRFSWQRERSALVGAYREALRRAGLPIDLPS